MSKHICKRAAAGDLASLLRVYAESFGLPDFVPPSEEYISRLLGNPAVVFLAAHAEGRVVGGLTAYLLPSAYSAKSELYLYDLAVLPDFRRQGIGTALLQALKEWARSRDVSEVYVQADADDAGALAFYRATGGAEEDVRHFSYSLVCLPEEA